MFEPYVEKISPYRKLVLTLDIHPVLVHFPQAFTFTILVLVVLCLILSGALGDTLLATFKTLSFCLPFTVAATIAAGLFDGKIRFRKVTTPILKKKIHISSVFFILSVANLFLVLYMPVSKAVLTGSLILVFLCFICSLILGLLGVKLLNSKFPG
jgi:O-antigen/teichoic acid export membrane protein